MKTSQLKILLSKLQDFQDPEPALEQYSTPPDVAADMLNRLHLRQISGQVIDLGCGAGILSIGAAALGFRVVGIDTDPEALETARENKRWAEEELERELDIRFVQSDIRDLEASDIQAETVIMNPPFGIQHEDANLRFLEKAFSIADHVFALLHRPEEDPHETRQFIKRLSSKHRFEATILRTYQFRLPKTMEFHTEQARQISVDLYYFQHTTYPDNLSDDSTGRRGTR